MSNTAEVLFQLIRIALGKEANRSLPNVVNWQDVYELSVAQGVCAIVYDGLQLCKDEADVKETIEEQLWYTWLGQSMVKVNDSRSKWAAAANLSKLWLRHGIRPVVLKGLSYAQFYPKQFLRQCSDLDTFLFEDWEKGNRIVEEDGVDVGRTYYKNSSFTYQGLFVENHKYCVPIRGNKKRKEYEIYLERILEEYPLTPIAGTSFLCPPPLFNILLFMSHAQNHFLFEGGIQLRHVCDWGVLMDVYRHCGTGLWNEFVLDCKKYGMLAFAYSMSQVASHVCNIEIPFDCPVNEGKDSALVEEIIRPTCAQVEFQRGWHTRGQLIRATLQSGWKFTLYSDQNLLNGVIQSVWGYLFEKNPKLDKPFVSVQSGFNSCQSDETKMQ